MTHTTPDLLITGASGHLGRLVLQHLLETLEVPAGRIVAATRHPEKLADLAAKGIGVRVADFDDPAGLKTAFAGIRRVLLISTDALDVPGRRLKQQQNAVRAAEKAGVRHVIYTSMPEPQGSPLLIAPDHVGTEQALAASALPGWTVLRNSWYFENLFLSLGQLKATGTWYTAAKDGRIAHISRTDLARAAATVLAGEESGKTTHTLTGSEAFTTDELAALVGQVLGTPIEVVHVPLEGLIQSMVVAGLPEPLAAVFASFDSNTAAGRVARVTEDYQKLTGVTPQKYADWLQANQEAIKSA